MFSLTDNRVGDDPWEAAIHNPMLLVEDSLKKASEKLRFVFIIRDPPDRYFHLAPFVRIPIRGVQSIYYLRQLPVPLRQHYVLDGVFQIPGVGQKVHGAGLRQAGGEIRRAAGPLPQLRNDIL